MAVPKKKVSKRRRDIRRSHHALTAINLHECSNCGSKVLSHHVCKSCGHYDKESVIAQPQI